MIDTSSIQDAKQCTINGQTYHQQQPIAYVQPPSNAIVFHPRNQAESDASFSQYLEHQFRPYSAVFQDRLSLPPASSMQEHTTVTNTLDIEKQQEPGPWWVADWDEDGFYSIGALLFLFGFILPPLWWIGACWPRHPRQRAGKMAERWQRLNMAMSIGFSVLLIIALVVTAAIYGSRY
ncbi:hypothetical protein LRAMOSA01874 [Lichtheimia ramosa]|uniref:Uncharacterized protein n=1 Tax=Lichtheimia ramosa TaxID=688394 RepID=A0A077WKL8_9FUNG|nr:hypothetical protein LRAMOSA01874 [Lichtheimia ramosa]